MTDTPCGYVYPYGGKLLFYGHGDTVTKEMAAHAEPVYLARHFSASCVNDSRALKLLSDVSFAYRSGNWNDVQRIMDDIRAVLRDSVPQHKEVNRD